MAKSNTGASIVGRKKRNHKNAVAANSRKINRRKK
jgi:hypothetical protein